MKFNSTKCSFGVSSSKFVGYVVTQCGIEANSNQIHYVMEIPFPTSIKDVQRLARRVATLSWLISNSLEKCHLFFVTIYKSKDFQ